MSRSGARPLPAWRRILTGALACLPLLAGATVKELPVGGVPIGLPVADDEVSIASASPELFNVFRAGIPAEVRLLAALSTRGDFDRMMKGEAQQDVSLMVLVPKLLEDKEFTRQEWIDARPALTRGMQEVDVAERVQAETAGSNQRMSQAAGMDVSVSYGKVDAPTIYRQTDDALYYTMRVPVKVSVKSEQGEMLEDSESHVVGSIVFVRGKVVFINGYADVVDHRPDDGLAPDVLLRQRLEDRVARVLEINAVAPAPAAPDAPAADGQPSKSLPLKKPADAGKS
ncbi:hypothetical protein [Arenimonas sp. MALMAid1274]|uniref:hypothetical protein n=1 Tax=Arenimonas sp. MALMAid1274 TaxID=3411630 RepID=UPI003B9E399C